MDVIIATTSEELKNCLMDSVQHRINCKDSQSAAAREWGIPQSTVNEIAKGKDKFTVQYLIELLMRDGLVVKMELI